MKNYSYLFIEKYGHGSQRRTDRTDIVTIRDSDNYYYVYESETDQDAAKIADWFCTAADAQSNCNFHTVEGEGREYFVSVIEPDDKGACAENMASIYHSEFPDSLKLDTLWAETGWDSEAQAIFDDYSDYEAAIQTALDKILSKDNG